MRFHDIKRTLKDGDGVRAIVYVSGCIHHCPWCQNPCTWDPDYGALFDESAKQEIFALLDDKYVQGITLSGGDPLHPSNRGEVGDLVKEISEKFPDKDIWLYTGSTFEEALAMELDWLHLIDVLVDGKYVAEKRDIATKWRGSTNQRVIDVKASINTAQVVLYCD